MKRIEAVIKPYLRWVIIGGTLFFLAKTFQTHWQEVLDVQIQFWGWSRLISAIFITLLAHICSAGAWVGILRAFKQPMGLLRGIDVYLITNMGKYLPGNVWHFYGRINALKAAGGSLPIASFTVLLEPLLTVAVAMAIALVGWTLSWQGQLMTGTVLVSAILSVVVIFGGIHPRVLNPLIAKISQFKHTPADTSPIRLKVYPWWPVIGAFSFLGLRTMGFLLTLFALMPVALTQLPQLFSAFSFAWVLGVIIPGVPGGIGVFETAALELLHNDFAMGPLLSSLALFRVVSLLAEMSGAGLAMISEQVGSITKR